MKWFTWFIFRNIADGPFFDENIEVIDKRAYNELLRPRLRLPPEPYLIEKLEIPPWVVFAK